MKEKKDLYRIFTGTLPAGYVGNLIYQFQLKEPCSELIIRFHYETGEISKKTLANNEEEACSACLLHTGSAPSDDVRTQIRKQMKTELQLGAFLSGTFFGNIHKPGEDKEMHFGTGERREGCMAIRGPYMGLLKLVINSFGIIHDAVSFRLEVWARPVLCPIPASSQPASAPLPSALPGPMHTGSLPPFLEHPVLKRVELHNHSRESDGQMSVTQLADYLVSRGIHSFSLTDHNTVSGQESLEEYSRKKGTFSVIPGYELTSYHGHLLCQNIREAIPWDDLDMLRADSLLERVHRLGGIAGPAHPASFPHPVSNGLAFDLRIRDWTLVDFMEIVNNAHPAFPDNRKAVTLWEEKICEGFRIAPVSGMDLHRPVDMQSFHRTWLWLNDDKKGGPDTTSGQLSRELVRAVREGKTIVSRGPIPLALSDGRCLYIRLDRQTDERMSSLPQPAYYHLLLQGSGNRFYCRIEESLCLPLPLPGWRAGEQGPLILELFTPETEPTQWDRTLPEAVSVLFRL